MILYRYMTKEMLKSVMTTTLVLLCIFVCVEFAHYLKNAAGGKLSLPMVLQMLLLQVPFLLSVLLPLGFFLGAQMALGQMYIHYEMVVIHACGVSMRRITWLILRLACFVSVLVALMTFVIQPRMAHAQKELLLQSSQTAMLDQITPQQFQIIKGGRWIFYANRTVENPRGLEGIFVGMKTAKKNHPDRQEVLVAKHVRQGASKTLPGNFLIFKDGYRYSGVPGSKDFEVVHFDEYGIRMQQPDTSTEKRYQHMSTQALWHQHAQNKDYLAELHWRLALALSVLVLVPYVLPFSRTNPRQGRFIRLLPALLVYVSYISLMFVGRVGLQLGYLPTWLGMWWVHAIALSVGVFVYRTRQGVQG